MFPALLPFSLTLPSWHSDIVFVGILVALDTVVEITDSFLDMLATDFLL
jgi:hypothetical protein